MPVTSDNIRYIPSAGAPIATDQAEGFYTEVLHELSRLGLPFLVAGTYAVSAYTGISRPTKDFDVFCKGGDYPRILGHFQTRGYAVEIEDERWLGKIYKGKLSCDVIFASSNGTMPVNDQWFEDTRETQLFGVRVHLVGPTELLWSKAFIQVRHRYDGADVVHIILKLHDQIDWRRLLGYMELHWEVLLMHILNFRWIYPTEREHVPRWLIEELMGRLQRQLALPTPRIRTCRGRMFSRADYEIAIREWGFADADGDEVERNG
jgi:hypothetical protein